jgi:hypothetical protein
VAAEQEVQALFLAQPAHQVVVPEVAVAVRAVLPLDTLAVQAQ